MLLLRQINDLKLLLKTDIKMYEWMNEWMLYNAK